MKKLTHNWTLSIGTLTLTLRGTTLVEDVEPKPKSDNKPTSEAAIFLAQLFGRSKDTAWSDKEIGAYVKNKALFTPEHLASLKAYYEAERAKGTGKDGGVHRRDLMTLLSNAAGELDRAKAHQKNGAGHTGAGRFGI